MSESTITKINCDGATWPDAFPGGNPRKFPCTKYLDASASTPAELRTVLRNRGWRCDDTGDFCENHISGVRSLV